MPIELRMPALSPTMEQGTLARWLVGVGDLVTPGDLIAEIETDKATMEFEAVDEGRVAILVVQEGTDDIPVGTVIAMLEDAGNDRGHAGVAASVEPVQAGTPPILETAPAPVRSPLPPTTAARVPARPRPANKDVSPLAARIAKARGLDLATIDGSGPNGRIVTADLGPVPMMRYTAPTTVVAAASLETSIHAAPADIPYGTGDLLGVREPVTPRPTPAMQATPHFHLSIDCRINAMLDLCARLNASSVIELSVDDLLIKALALALEEVPEANVGFASDRLHRFGRVDVSVAVEEELAGPVIVDAASKRLSVIARERRLAPGRDGDGTVAISNLGAFGIERVFPALDGSQAMILGVGAPWPPVRAGDGQAAGATMLTATAGFDRRVIGAAVAARVMSALRSLVEEPIRLIA
ncbi:2-oxo acid dehydrogenase subunit E2 [uncultured Sphingomonas sp.]|uniref:2-oxo acid dehydrogenase subunit E2 n=1 Tax=uncultured Sphingomonas sp. TaxID=158754 RepID=UPI0035CA0B47